MPFRTSLWAPLCIIIVISSALYLRMLILIFKKRNSQQYSSFFYKMFFIAGIFDLISVYWFVGSQWIYIDQIFGPQILLDISHDNIPSIFYYHVFYFLFAQVFTITLVSANRLCSIHFPMSRMLATCDRFPSIILFLATMVFPVIISIHVVFQENVEFRLSNGTVERWVSPRTLREQTLQAACTVSIFNIFSAICYILIIQKLTKLNRDRSRDLSSISRKWRREIALTVVGFSTFVALCMVTCYFSINQYAVVTDNSALLTSNRQWQIYYFLVMAFVNPWMLLITNGSMRKNIFQNISSVEAPSVARTGATLPTTSSRQVALAHIY